ncbi:MAG: hypothetical protein ACREFD_04610 [Stellaceae bacterium]
MHVGKLELFDFMGPKAVRAADPSNDARADPCRNAGIIFYTVIAIPLSGFLLLWLSARETAPRKS